MSVSGVRPTDVREHPCVAGGEGAGVGAAGAAALSEQPLAAKAAHRIAARARLIGMVALRALAARFS